MAQVSNHLGYLKSHDDKDTSIKYKDVIKRMVLVKGHLAKHMTTEPKLRIHNITSNSANSVHC
jgi:hypothetical protein